jgi:hypothetical protein
MKEGKCREQEKRIKGMKKRDYGGRNQEMKETTFDKRLIMHVHLTVHDNMSFITRMYYYRLDFLLEFKTWCFT